MFLHGILYHTDAVGVENKFDSGNGPIFLSNVNCIGNERRLVECPTSDFLGNNNCMHSQDIGVMCQPMIYPGECYSYTGPCMYHKRP